MASFKDLLDYLSTYDILNKYNFSQVKTIHQTLDSASSSNGSSSSSTIPGHSNCYSHLNHSPLNNNSIMADIYCNSSATNTSTAAVADAKTAPTAAASTSATAATARSLILQFSHSTSMHGVSRAMGEAPLWRRALWAVLVIGFVAWSVRNVSQILSDYDSHPILTSVTTEYQSKMKFPAVTICNLNRVRQSKASPLMRQVIRAHIGYCKNNPNEFSLPLAFPCFMNCAAQFGMEVEYVNSVVSILLRSYDREQQREMGHQIEHMLYRCHFGTEYCSPENFTYIYNLHHGNCYTFASNLDLHRSEWTTMRAGPKHGLKMELDIQYDEYLSSTPVAGIKVLVHDNGEVPFPEDGGVTAGTGVYTSIAVKKTQVKRIPSPHANCMQEVDLTNKNKNLFADFGFTYSLNGCQKSCFQEHVYRKCKCCDSSVPCIEEALQFGTDVTAPHGSIDVCNTSVLETAQCVDELVNAFSENKLDCIKTCAPACEEATFSTTVSTGRWPTHNYWSSILWQWGYRLDGSLPMEYFERTYLRVEVYYDSLILEKIKSQPAYTWNKLLGDIGGQLGLLLGFSILTAVEIIELVVIDLGLGLGLRKLWTHRNRKEERHNGKIKTAWG